MAAGPDDEAIDQLYQAPLNEFTAKRNALVKTLRGADATRVRTLAKPSVVAWAVNQIYWQARPLYDRVIKSGERLRRAQITALEGRSADVRGATDAHRRAVAEAVAEAERLANPTGSHPSRDALMRTFEALSLAAEPPEAPGRLSDALQPAGFEALTGITPKPETATRGKERDRRPESERSPAPRASSSSPATRPHDGGRAKAAAVHPAEEKHAERERQREQAAEARRQAAAEKERQAEIRRLRATVERAKSAEAEARAEWERARDALQEAEKHLKSVM